MLSLRRRTMLSEMGSGAKFIPQIPATAAMSVSPACRHHPSALPSHK